MFLHVLEASDHMEARTKSDFDVAPSLVGPFSSGGKPGKLPCLVLVDNIVLNILYIIR